MAFLKAINAVICAVFVMYGTTAQTLLSARKLSIEDATRSFEAELVSTDFARLKNLEDALNTTYHALPKNTAGNLGHQVVRYALHRMFIQRHGWFIKGLEPSSDRHNSENNTEWVPSYLQSLLESRVGEKGANLHELSVLAAALEDLIDSEARGRLRGIFETMGLPVEAPVSGDRARQAIRAYYITLLHAGDFPASNAWEFERKLSAFTSKYKDWDPAERWLDELLKPKFAAKPGNAAFSFDEVALMAESVGENYYKFNEAECHALKGTLIDTEGPKGEQTGRLPLAAFYEKGLQGHWALSEKPEYLRSLGALDESDIERFQVIVPNYVAARPNCLDASSLYAICCRNECEDLMSSLEAQLGSAWASPSRIVDVVAGLSSDTVAAPRALGDSLRSRLSSVAASNGGRVPLHGRLFAQWMHHAFPNECPYPHTAKVNPLTPDEWMEGETAGAKEMSREEMQQMVQADKCAGGSGKGCGGSAGSSLPWTHEESLLVASAAPGPPPAAGAARRALLGAGRVSEAAAAKMLEAELASTNATRLARFEDALRTTFLVLPKNEAGNLGHEAVRYALHRMFVQRHGWFIKGLEPSSDSTSSENTEWVPSYLQSMLESRVGEKGASLHDLAAFAASLEDLVDTEARGRLEAIFAMLDMPVGVPVPAEGARKVLKAYYIFLLKGGKFAASNRQEAETMMADFATRYTDWDAAERWLDGLLVPKFAAKPRDALFSFDEVALMAEDVGENYYTFNERECHALKETLTGLEGIKAGRVRLSFFYQKGLHSHWSLQETPEFLRALGALDESEADALQVIVPNYVMARTNCLDASGLYAICCRNQCEDLMGTIETKIGAASADPSRIEGIVGGMSSDTVAAPRSLPSVLLARLREIATVNGGQVPLHGRLFAQWMHHAFPRECPYPHEAGVNPQTPDEWMASRPAESREMSREEMQKTVEADRCAGGLASGRPKDCGALSSSDLPWTPKESLLVSAAVKVSESDAAKTLEAELNSTDSERLSRLEDLLRTTFSVLPKNAFGNLGHEAVRYALHRMFIQRHGWFIKGLEPTKDTPSSINNAEWIPSYLQSMLESRLGNKGADLHNLAKFAAAMEDLIDTEAHGRLEVIFKMLDMAKGLPLSAEMAREAIRAYFISLLLSGNFKAGDKSEAQRRLAHFTSNYADWDSAERWLNQLLDPKFAAKPWSVPFSFEEVASMAEDVGENFFKFNDLECRALKGTLTAMEGIKAGRVRLSFFYQKGLHSHWSLNEKPEFLRALGALDDSEPEMPQVIVPNYVMARTNCLEASGLYAICCRNECEDLMGTLEAGIGSAWASPKRITDIVAGMSSDTVAAPRVLPGNLVSRLDEIAAGNGGQVPLHGRLFAQWMHHAFPRECPYPHEADANPQTPDEWMAGKLPEAAQMTREEMQKTVEADQCASGLVLGRLPRADDCVGSLGSELPWTPREALLVSSVEVMPSEVNSGNRQEDDASASSFGILHVVCVLGLAVLLCFQGMQMRFGHAVFREKEQDYDAKYCKAKGQKTNMQKATLVGVLAAIAFLLGLLDVTIFACAVIGAVISVAVQHTAKDPCSLSSKDEFYQKCIV